MSAIARVLLEMGYLVSGSDVARQELTEKLVAKGARVFIGHQAEHVKGADLVVYSTALAKDNVEMLAAEELNIPIIHRSQMLARLLNTRKGIAVAGAHGKTTTSSMIALIMEDNDLDPTYIIGGEILNVGSNAKAGKGDVVVAEADESDGSFLQYHPKYAVVTNIEADHLENYDGKFENLQKAYVQFLSQVKSDGKAIMCADDPYVRELLPDLNCDVITFSTQSDATFTARNIELGDRRARFILEREGIELGPVELSVPGMHNVYNALAAFIVCLEAGLSFAQIAKSIKKFRGAKRRFQVIGEFDGILVIDDYAHHPTEIEATISAAKATGKRIIAVFQPQRYTRTFFLLEPFSRAFKEADEVIVTDIFSPAGEERIEGVSSERLVEMIRKNSNPNAQYIASQEDVRAYLAKHASSGDVVLTMGAGDIYKTAHAFAELLQSKQSIQ